MYRDTRVQIIYTETSPIAEKPSIISSSCQKYEISLFIKKRLISYFWRTKISYFWQLDEKMLHFFRMISHNCSSSRNLKFHILKSLLMASYRLTSALESTIYLSNMLCRTESVKIGIYNIKACNSEKIILSVKACFPITRNKNDYIYEIIEGWRVKTNVDSWENHGKRRLGQYSGNHFRGEWIRTENKYSIQRHVIVKVLKQLTATVHEAQAMHFLIIIGNSTQFILF